jgi:NAD(P)-dependent dehydrogenase (short-subunit alcohol dehydrogenase family)
MTDDRHAHLAGQVALVVGGGGAIGGAIARRLLDVGARTAVVDRSSDTMHKQVPEAVLALTADATDPNAVEEVVGEVVSKLGRLDVLVNAAGVHHVAEIGDVALRDWRHVFAANLDAPLLTMQSAVRAMQRQAPHPGTGCRGKIVNVSSSAAELPVTRSTAYGASKIALNYTTRCVAEMFGRDGIVATLVYPGNVDSDLWRGIANDVTAMHGDPYESFVAERLASIPTGAFQDARDLAEIVLWIAALEGAELNGKTVWTEAHVEF